MQPSCRFLFLAAVLTPTVRAADYSAKVIGVTDGDTITVLYGRTQSL